MRKRTLAIVGVLPLLLIMACRPSGFPPNVTPPRSQPAADASAKTAAPAKPAPLVSR